MRWNLLILYSFAVLHGCDSTDPLTGGAFEVALRDLPTGDTLRQTGIEFAFESNGATPYQSVEVRVDPGTAAQRSFFSDSAWRAEAPAAFPVVVGGPLANGRHVFELRVVDANGRTGSVQFNRVVHVPEVPYTLQFLGGGFDDSRAAGITPTGVIVGTVYTGVSATQTSQIVTWSNGVRVQPRSQANVGSSFAGNINDAGEIVGSARVNGTQVGVHWRGDSLQVLKVNGENTLFASDIDEAHRALVLGPGLKTYFLDINTSSATHVSFGMGRMNGLGQMVALSAHLYGTMVSTYGGLTIKFPEMRPGRHERLFRGITWAIVGLNDRGEVLGSREGDAFLSHDTAEYLAQRLPNRPLYVSASPSPYTLAPTGDVAVVAGADSVYVWSKLAGTRRLTFTNTGWSITGFVAMNASGQLVAHGINEGASQRGVLLLTPTAASVQRP